MCDWYKSKALVVSLTIWNSLIRMRVPALQDALVNIGEPIGFQLDSAICYGFGDFLLQMRVPAL